MKEIELTQGKVALVDDVDFERINRHKWCLSYGFKTTYAKRYSGTIAGKQTFISMHRFIINAPQGMEVDHINGDGLDNRKSNLRICTLNQNRQNRALLRHNTSGYIGVSYYKDRDKWGASIRANNTQKHLGFFKKKEEAALAYNEAALKYRGEFAYLNEVTPSLSP